MMVAQEYRKIVKMLGLSRTKKQQKPWKQSFQPSDLYKVRRSIASSGEHFSLLVDARTGLPVVRPNTYILIVRRDRCQSSTLENELNDLALLSAWAEFSGLDLEAVLDRGNAPSHAELNSLIDALRTDYRRSPREVSTIFARALVQHNTWARRIVVARDYVAWRLEHSLRQCEPGSLRHEHVRQQRDQFVRAMNSLMPSSHSLSAKEGLGTATWERLLAVVEPSSQENPFHPALRTRNALIIQVLGYLGPRKGELLKLRTSQISTGLKPSITIERRPDDPSDPRPYQPQVKTRGRKIPLDPDLAQLAQKYIMTERARIPNAKRSPFLLLARSGQPLSLRGLDKVFAQIILRYPEFSGVLSPHALRHTANDALSEALERDGCSIEESSEIRNYLMGWSPSSQQGLKYSRRHIEAKAQQVLLDHQRRIFHGDAV